MDKSDKQKHRYYLNLISDQVKQAEGNCFVECGVKYGTTSIIIARNLMCQGYLFDTWKRFEGISEIDGSNRRINRIRKRRLGHIEELCKDSLVKNGVSDYCVMIKGNVIKTIPKFLDRNKNISIKLLHLDMDLYLPTNFALNNLWDKMSDNGIVFVHDYGNKRWKGIQKSVDDFAKERGIGVEKLDMFACIMRKGK